MVTKTVGIRELKARMETYLQLVKTGAEVVITKRGKPIGRIVPMRPSMEERMHELVATGVIKWSGRRFSPRAPSVRTRGNKTLSDLALENRE